MSTTSPTARTGWFASDGAVVGGGAAERWLRSWVRFRRCFEKRSTMLEADLEFRKEQFSSNNPTECGIGQDESRLRRRFVQRDHYALLVNGCRCSLERLAREVRAEKVCEVRIKRATQKPHERRDCQPISPLLFGVGSNNLAAKTSRPQHLHSKASSPNNSTTQQLNSSTAQQLNALKLRASILNPQHLTISRLKTHKTQESRLSTQDGRISD